MSTIEQRSKFYIPLIVFATVCVTVLLIGITPLKTLLNGKIIEAPPTAVQPTDGTFPIIHLLPEDGLISFSVEQTTSIVVNNINGSKELYVKAETDPRALSNCCGPWSIPGWGIIPARCPCPF